jgi:iron complex outermembrane recepter protein
MGGLVKFDTQAPSLTTTTGAAQVGGSGIPDSGGTGYSVRGALSTPLVLDKLAVSVSGFYREDPGYITDPSLDRSNLDAEQSYGGRIAIQGQLTDTLRIRVGAIYQDQRQAQSSQVDVNANGTPIYGDLEHERLIGTDGFNSRTQFYDLILDNDFGPVTVSSLTGYSRLFTNNPLDYTKIDGGNYTSIFGLTNPGGRLDSSVATDKYTEELRATSNDTGLITYVAGLYYGYEKSAFDQARNAVNDQTGVIIPGTTIVGMQLGSSFEEFAGYVTATLNVSSQFDIQVGGRFSHDKISSSEFDYDYTGPLDVISGSPNENPATFNVAPRYHFSNDWMAYARVSSGYRAGGTNAGLPATVDPTYHSDNLINYEGGVKGETADGLLSGTLAVYYIDWRNIQVTQKDDVGDSYITNAGTAKSEGVEAAVTARPIAPLTLTGTVTYDDAALTENAPPNTFYGVKGDRLPYSARWTGTADGQYTVPVTGQASAFLGGDVLYLGDRLSDFVANSSQTRFNLAGFTTVDLRTGADWKNWVFTVFARNVGDRRGIESVRAEVASNRAPYAASIVTPRTIGASIAAKF